MSYQVFLQRLPKDTDEAFLIFRGHIKSMKIVCEENECIDEENHIIYHSCTSIDEANKIAEQCNNMTFEEYDPFYDNSFGRMFRFSHVSYSPDGGVYLLIFNQVCNCCKMIRKPNINCVEDKKNVLLLLNNQDLNNTEKAEKLVAFLLDRQMIIDDAEEDNNNSDFVSAEYAEFYDQVKTIVKELDHEVYEHNENQIFLPELEDFIDRYK